MKTVPLKLIAIFLSLTCALNALCASKGYSRPDFAYPQTVAKNSSKTLDAALARGNDKEALRALMDYSLAQSSIGSDNYPSVLSKINSTCTQLSSPAAKAFASLLAADIYRTIFNSDSYVYNSRKLPLLPRPSDFTEWSGDQFREVVVNLCNQALSDPLALQQIPLADYDGLITVDSTSKVYFPTLFDFIAHRSIDILNDMSPFSVGLGFISLAPRAIFILNPGDPVGSPFAAKVLDIYASLLRFHAPDSAPGVYCDLERIGYVTDRLYSNLSDKSEPMVMNLLLGLYDKTLFSQWAGDVLIAMSHHMSPPSGQGSNDYLSFVRYYAMLESFVKLHPNFSRIGCITDILARFSQKSIHMLSPSTVSPGKDFNVKLLCANTTDLTIKIYKCDIKSSENEINATTLAKLKPFRTLNVNLTGTVPFRADTTVTISLPDYGAYVIVPSADYTTRSGQWHQVIRCTDLDAGTIIDNKSAEAFIINPLTGAPVDKADIYVSDGNKREKLHGNSDAGGFIALPTDNFDQFRPVKGHDRYAASAHYYMPYSMQSTWQYSANIITDLPVYHPGDSVKWAAVTYSYLYDRHNLTPARNFRAILYNVNRMPVDTLDVTSDEWGRITGAFHIPEGELTGQYNIALSTTDGDDTRDAGRRYFMVSDYKMPTYYIELDQPATGFPSAGDITLRGVAKSYSGVPMAGIPVKAVVSVSVGRWWFRSNTIDFCNLADTTDADGKFSLVLTNNAIQNSPAPDGYFSAVISATSLNGESRQATCDFTVGNAYAIVSSLPQSLDVAQSIDLTRYFKVLSSKGDAVTTPMRYTLTDNRQHKLISTGTITSGVDWQKLPASTYTLSVFTPELKADTLQTALILYRDNADVSPTNDVLWAPKQDFNADRHGDATALVFASESSTHGLLVTSVNNTFTSREWIKLNKGANRIKLHLPDDVESAQFYIVATRNYTSGNLTFNVKNPEADKSLSIIAESFRDKLTPGNRETWTFRTVGRDSTGIASAVMAGMHNKALDAIVSSDWSLSFRTGYRGYNYLRSPSFGPIFTATTQELTRSSNCIGITDPRFMTYGLSFRPQRNKLTGLMIKGSMADHRLYSLRKEAVEDLAVEEVYDAAMPMANAAMKMESKSTADTGSGVATTESEEEVSSDGLSSPLAGAEPFKYRQSETPLAFFMPQLTSRPDGSMQLTFTVPDANAQWNFTALAYDRNMTTARLQHDFTASKPLMVQPNLPRFLRTGDDVTINATVINNYDAAAEVNVSIEIFSPSDMKIISSPAMPPLSMAPNESKVVSAIVTAPSDLPVIGYRIKVSDGKFTDGEQAFIPVLPSSTPVIESMPFYIAPDSLEFSRRLPDYPANSTVTLQYCDNPTWYVVTALPGLTSRDSRTAPDAAAAIFSAAVADGILRSYPQVKKALTDWLASDKSDSTLVSMLQRNNDLKTFLLQATPWMLDAQSDTQRMQRLALLFDKKNITQTIERNINLLAKLQRSDGGLAWIAQYKKSSEWATYSTLTTLGRLNSLGFLPDSKRLRSIINKALSYYQGEVERAYKKLPMSDYTSFVMLTDRFPDFKMSLTGQKLVARTVQHWISTWKKAAMPSKVNAALILANHGYKPVAQQILASLREFAKQSPTQGMWWPLLDDMASGSMSQLTLTADALSAFHLIEPESNDIDLIRQWLILQKEARDWGNGNSATQVAAAILLTSPKWVDAAAPFTVTVGHDEVTPLSIERNLGCFRCDISDMEPSGKTLSVSRSAGAPAWGAVMARSTRVMKDVKAQECEAISIEKRLYRQDGDRWEEAPAQLKVGDRVRVQLLIHASRALDYVAIADSRSACLEPVEQLPVPIYAEGLCFYRENNDEATNIFIDRLPKGTYMLTYDLWVNNAGTFSSGIATIQSQYAPQFTAHSAGATIEVKD